MVSDVFFDVFVEESEGVLRPILWSENMQHEPPPPPVCTPL